MELEWSQRREAGVALVSVRLRNETVLDRRVRLQNRLAGPVLPPRTEGVPEAGWDRDGVTVRVPTGETVALGYACPVADASGDAEADAGGDAEAEQSVGSNGERSGDPPLVVTDVGPPAAPSPGVNHAVRRLGDPRPPRAVVAGPGSGAGAEAEATAGERPVDAEGPGDEETDERDDAGSGPDTWLSGVRDRVAAADHLEGASVVEAAAILESTDAVGDVAELETALAADERALRRVGGEATVLADRVAETDPPVEALRRLS